MGSAQREWNLRSVPQDLVEQYRAAGEWRGESLGSMVADGLGSMGHVQFAVHSRVRPWTGSFAEVDRAARSLAGGLRARGVGAGDVVVLQLPNWVEAGIAFWAAAYLGAVVVPIVHFYGAKEVDYIVGAVRPDVVVTADRFGHSDHLATYAEVLARPPRHAVAGGGGDPRRVAPAAGDALRRPPRRATRSPHRPPSIPPCPR